MNTTNNNENYSERAGQSSQHGTTGNNENYTSQEMNREHSDQVRAGEHNIQDETQYGKIRQSETGSNTEQRAGHLRNEMNEGMHKAGSKVNDWTDKAENKMDEWSDKAKNKMNDMKDNVENKMNEWSGKSDHERAADKYEKADKKMDKVEKKMDKAEDKFAKGYENDGMRKMDKAEKKMNKAEDKIQDAHEELGHNTGYSSSNRPMNDNVEDYEHRAGKGNPFDNENNTNQGGLR